MAASVATLIEGKATFADHWVKDLDRYFPDGIDTTGIIMNRIKAQIICHWDGKDEGEVRPLA